MKKATIRDLLEKKGAQATNSPPNSHPEVTTEGHGERINPHFGILLVTPGLKIPGPEGPSESVITFMLKQKRKTLVSSLQEALSQRATVQARNSTRGPTVQARN